jgi:glycosyltransferase involved in cell wall biosynthesis
MASEGFDVTLFPGRGLRFAALRVIRRRLAALQPDVLHVNDSPALTAGSVASLGLHIPVRVVSRRVHFPVRWKIPYRHLCDRVLCVSHAVADVCRAVGIPAESLRIVHDGSDPQRIHAGDRRRGRQALGIDETTLLLLTVAGLRDEKGHRYLLNALPTIFDHYPQAVCALAGDGELADALRQQTSELGIVDRVRFLGYRDDTPDLLAACDLFVLPSHNEGLCTSLIDAMLAARPIVTTTAGGIMDLVGERLGAAPVAWAVPPRDSPALAAATLEALSSPGERLRRQELARSRAERHFTSRAMINATLAVYHEVLGARARAA